MTPLLALIVRRDDEGTMRPMVVQFSSKMPHERYFSFATTKIRSPR